MNHFIFWGLFVALALVVGAYATWLVWVERKERRQAHRNDGGPDS